MAPAAVARAPRIAVPAVIVAEDPEATVVALEVIEIEIVIAVVDRAAVATGAAKVRPKWISRS